VLEKLDQLEFDSVLDVGCGTGTLLALIISKKNDIMVSGIDLSPEMIRVAKEQLRERAELRVGDSERLPWVESSFNVVVNTDSFHHYPNPEKALTEMKKVLKSNGHLIIADSWKPTPIRQIMNSFMRFNESGDVRIYSRKEICRLLEECGFELIEWELINREAYIVTAIT